MIAVVQPPSHRHLLITLPCAIESHARPGSSGFGLVLSDLKPFFFWDCVGVAACTAKSTDCTLITDNLADPRPRSVC